MVPLDLARGKVATASSSQGDNSPARAIDGDGETRRCAANASFPQWWQVDLGKPQTVNGCLIAWEKLNTAHHYKIEGSADGQSWRMLSDQTDSLDRATDPGASVCGLLREASDAIRRAFDLSASRLMEATPARGQAFFDFEVFGAEKIKATAQSTVKPAGATRAQGGGAD